MRRKKRLWGVLMIITALIIMQLPVSEADAASVSDFRMEGNTLVKYRGTEESVSVPDGVEVIGEGAFEENPYVELVTLPDSVKRIDPYAFWGCDNLDSVVLGSGMTEIGDYAFAGCYGLKQMTLPGNITSIGIQAFGDCFNMTSIGIPQQTVSIHERAFDGCYQLRIQCQPGSIADQYAQEFYERQQEMPEYEDIPGYNGAQTQPEITPAPTEVPDEYSIFGSTQIVGNSAYFFVDEDDMHVYDGTPQSEAETLPLADFQNINTLNGIPKYTIVDGRIVADQAYYRSTKLGNVVLPDGIVEIGQFAFARSSISSVTIPYGAATIGYGAFYHCDYLDKVSIPTTVRTVEPKAFAYTGWVENFMQGIDGTEGDYLISGGVLVAYRGTDKEVAIPEGVRVIAGEVFRNHTEIESVTLPEGLLVVGEGAFEGCKYLTKLILPASVEEIKDRAFYGTGIAKGNVTLKAVRKLGVLAFGDATLRFSGEQPQITHESSAERLSNFSYRGEASEEIQTTIGVTVNGLSGVVATLEGADRGYTLTIGLADDTTAMQEGCYRTFKADMPDGMMVYDLELMETDSSIPLTKLGHQMLTVVIPVPESLKGQDIKLLTLDRNGQPEALVVERVNVDGVEGLLFKTNYISLFGIYGAGVATDGEELLELTVEMNSLSAAPVGAEEVADVAVAIPLWKRANVLVGAALFLTGLIVFVSGGKRRIKA